MVKSQSTKYLYLVIMTCALLFIVLMGTLSYAWLAGSGSVPCELVDGRLLSRYFHCGTGTEEDPFVITEPEHYYNMVYLYQLKKDFANYPYYFQLGYELKGEGNGFYVYDCDENGEPIREAASAVQVLDLKKYTDGLLPIGTAKTPFIGHFDGKGLTVKNLKVISSKELTDINGTSIYTTSDVGIFGYVGTFTPENGEPDEATIQNVYYDNVTIQLHNADALQECQGNDGLHEHGEDRIVYVGYLAGHITTSNVVSNVYINNCKIEGGNILNGNEAHSKFGYFGCVENSTTGALVTEISSRVATLRTAGENAGFGGSLDMQALFTRILTVLNNPASANAVYPSQEDFFIPTDGSSPISTKKNTAIEESDLRTWYSPSGGNYIGSVYNSPAITATFLYGLTSSPSQKTTITTYTQNGAMVNAYYIPYQDGWLALDGESFTSVEQKSDAAKWLVDENGYWYTYIYNTKFYLNSDGTGIIAEDNVPLEYTIKLGSNYLRDNNGILEITADPENATEWIFSSTTNPDAPSGTIRSAKAERYLYVERTEVSSSGCNTKYGYELKLGNISQDSQKTWNRATQNNNNVYQNEAYDRYYLTSTINNNKFYVESSNNVPGQTVALEYSRKYYTDTPGQTDPNTYIDTEYQLYTYTASTVRRGTYIPIRVQKNSGLSFPDDYAVHIANTGYIVGGAYSTDTNGGKGDIRVSRYAVSNINGSYSGGILTDANVYTYNSNGRVPITNPSVNLTQYAGDEGVKAKFLTMLSSSGSDVYGLHFMNAAISTDHTIKAESATILGKTYVNYDLPESCIDFDVQERGFITFMAGSYFTTGSKNNAFFSLHHVYRDADTQQIVAIKLISKIYSVSGGSSYDAYVYEYSDGTFTNADGSYAKNGAGNYVGSPSLPSGKTYNVVFDTTWIMDNPEIESDNNDVYYFEIPCNSGEYALGSVDGKTGAYLLYLDIASNGGDIVESVLGSYNDGDNNSAFANLQMDFRSSPEISDWSLMQFQINCPSSTADNFNVSVKFDRSDNAAGHTNGCYTITVENRSENAVELWVYLYDDDDNPSNAYEYAYRLKYINGDHATETVMMNKTQDFWKSAAGFLIPATDDMHEVHNYSTSP